jgi:AcrR family transcriptional regulator
MAELKTTNTEQAILEAAETLFIEKGFNGTKTTEIAKVAGVNHAMLHYYFRTKEKLFNQIFEQKASQLLGFFVQAFDMELPFFEKLKIGIETHFDFIAQQPGLPLFVLREIIQNKERKDLILQKALPMGVEILKRMAQAINEEVNQGNICSVQAQNLLLNIASLNIFAFVAAQAIFDNQTDQSNELYKNFLEARKKNNVEVIINSLKI